MKIETLFQRLEESVEDHERVSRWLKEAPRDSHERRVHRNRQWEIRRKMNRYVDEIEKKLAEMEDDVAS